MANNTNKLLLGIIILFAILIICKYGYIKARVTDVTDVVGPVDVYLFWTGGFDSTFRLCQLLINEGKCVQPIYIMDKSVDGIPGGIRQSWHLEIATMDAIITHLHWRYPQTRRLLLPTMCIANMQLDREVLNTMDVLHHLGHISRPVNQWAYMAQVIRDMGITAEVGLIDEDTPYLRRALEQSIREVAYPATIKPNCAPLYDNHKFVDKRRREAYWFNKLNYAQHVIDAGEQPAAWSQDALVRHGKTTHIIDPSDKQLKIFHKMQFPLYNMRKNDLLNYAEEAGYSDVLRMTWSCWNPVAGQPCGKCEMCKDRIV